MKVHEKKQFSFPLGVRIQIVDYLFRILSWSVDSATFYPKDCLSIHNFHIKIYKLETILMLEGDMKSASNFKFFFL